MYHTQEFRGRHISAAIPTYRDDAWLGAGCYFWYDLEDAHAWGKSSKRKTGQYAVYESVIAVDKVLDTVFNEAHYLFWLRQIDKVLAEYDKLGRKPTLKELNAYLRNKSGLKDDITGILFQDMPSNASVSGIEPIQYGKYPNIKTRYFVYRKRVQLVVYDSKIIATFTSLTANNC